MGVAAIPAPWGLKPQNSPKKFAHGGVHLGRQLSQNHVPKVFYPGPPPLNGTFCNMGDSGIFLKNIHDVTFLTIFWPLGYI